MKVVIFGASGNVGRLVVQKALMRGLNMRAFVRDKQKLSDITSSKLELFEGDIYKPETVDKAIKGQDAVISTLGVKKLSGPLVCRDGINAMLPAMKKHKVKRLIALSAFGASEHRNFSPYTRVARAVIPLLMHDKDEMEALIQKSSLDWTIVRPPVYIEIFPKKGYETTEILGNPVPVITKNAVADCLLDQLETSENIKKAIAIQAA